MLRHGMLLSAGTAPEHVEEHLLDPAVGRVVQCGPAVTGGELRVRPVPHHQLDQAQVPAQAKALKGRLSGLVELVEIDGVAGGLEQSLQLRVVALLDQLAEPRLQPHVELTLVRRLGQRSVVQRGTLRSRAVQGLQSLLIDVLVPETEFSL